MFDFPASPTVGQKYPASPVAGVPTYTWDGEKWTTNANAIGADYVKKIGDTMSGALVLPADPTAALQAATKQYVDARFQRFALGGLSQQDVTVPTWVVGARVVVIGRFATATAQTTNIQFSVVPGVFRSTGDYVMDGFYHLTLVTPTAVTAINSYTGSAGALVHPGHANVGAAIVSRGELVFRRPNTSSVFSASFYGTGFQNAPGGFGTQFYHTYLTAAASGSALQMLAFRLINSPNVFDADSYLNIEWF